MFFLGSVFSVFFSGSVLQWFFLEVLLSVFQEVFFQAAIFKQGNWKTFFGIKIEEPSQDTQNYKITQRGGGRQNFLQLNFELPQIKQNKFQVK